MRRFCWGAFLGAGLVLRLLATLPWDVIGGGVALLVYALWGRGMRRDGEALSFELAPGSWPRRTWYRGWGGTTLGRVIWYAPGRRASDGEAGWPVPSIEVHEHEHVRQHEASSCGSMLVAGTALALGAPWWAALALWASGYPAMAAGGWLAAWLRGERFYKDSAHERAARAVARQGGNP